MKNKESTALTMTQQTLLGMIGHALFRKSFAADPSTDWGEVFRESCLQGVYRVAFQNCREHGVPAAFSEKIRSVAGQNVIRDVRVAAQHAALHTLMTEAGIPYTVLKGVASAVYYPDPTLRSMGDVDFFVDAEDLPRAEALLTSHGYALRETQHDRHRILDKQGIRLEMHYGIPGIPKGDAGKILNGYMEDLLTASVLSENETAVCVCPSPFHHGLIMLLHMQHHMLAEGIGLRHLCDWAVFLNSLGEERFVALFQEPLKRVGLWRFARLLSLTAAIFLGLPEMKWMKSDGHDDEIAAWLIADIMAGGNFGVKDPNRKYEGNYISDRGKDGVRKSRMTEGIASLNRITRAKCTFTQKHSWLLPVGWIVVLCGYPGRCMRRRRQGKTVSAVKAYRTSEPRRRLYRELALYETEPNQQEGKDDA